MDNKDVLEKAYRIVDWGDNPWSYKGKERYLRAIREFERLASHPWLAELLNNDSLSILDVGAGRGIGGVALAKVLMRRSVKVKLVMVDLREDAIEDARRFAREENVEAEAYVMDALDAYKLGRFDIVLMYGAILAHFNEWDMPRLFASAANALKDDGVIIIEEMDRVDMIFRKGFKEIIVENTDLEQLSISFHVRYDLITGSYYRAFVRLKDFEATILPLNFRSIAHIASTLWLFTKDVDIIPTEEESLYFVLGKEPRRAINPEGLMEDPTILKRGKPWIKSKENRIKG
ncbi:Methyltransferase type 12 [Pyrolobus fumarii 1A]|uniref:Methyltransferase type 12 n=1 Tax=Pyrolobus fumarii (strain DSM 11204 / 1A) TaxID=694429 RepID=G0EF01_PYRF1|nr:class I SAM-dependent methyltransferase [Pyrolobus fumarii]AEM38115.1 Methyltransferase type 12 [Pyrolobus fumarii 1A]